MNIFWEGTDITGYVTVRKALARDTCGGRCDGLDIEFENAESWYKWGPQEDDEIRVTQDGWDSGALYLNTIAPGDGKYRVIATALPCKARQKQWDSFENKTVDEILRKCAAMTGMEYRVYGIDETIRIPYIMRENEGCAAFLNRLAMLEGARFKVISGKYSLIGIEYAQDRNRLAEIVIAADQDGVDYRKSGAALRGLSVVTPYAKGKATDTLVAENKAWEEVTCLPALNDIQAARWARNVLLDKNRKCESVEISADFHPAWSAMSRIDIAGGTDADGQWLIEEAEHDLKNGRSRATLLRCIRTIK